MNYRFTSSENSVTISEMLDDIRRVLNFIKDTSEDYGIHTKNAMLVGWSSGGHMAELYGYKMSQEADIPVTCVTAYSGIADLTDKKLFVDNPLDEILNIQTEGRQKRREAEIELRNIEDQLKNKLINFKYK